MSAAESNVIRAAKAVVSLSGWREKDNGREVYQTSFMAVEVLRAAIQEAENPVLRLESEPVGVEATIKALAPAPLPRGL